MKRELYLRIILWVILGALAVFAFYHFDIPAHLTTIRIKAMVSQFGPWAPFMFIALFVLATLIFVPLIPLMLAAGALFGTWVGGLYATIGATLGAAAAFLFARHIGRSWVERLLGHRYHTMLDYYKKYEEHSFKFVVVTVIAPFLPFRPFNYLMGLTSMKLQTFVGASFLGLLPVMLLYAYVGDAAITLKFNALNASIVVIIVSASLLLWYRSRRDRQE